MGNRLMFGLAITVAVVMVAGCGKKGRPQVETVSVQGTVQLDGKPVEGAEVNFVTDQYAGIATTGSDGKYEMTAQAGENKVYIRKYDGEYDPTMTGSDTAGGKASGPKQLVPAKFSDPEKSELKFSVPEDGAENADFQLTSK
ncbi:MAG: hypothetical protein ACYC6Y_12265 [Thermoguttaceae bacterium]